MVDRFAAWIQSLEEAWGIRGQLAALPGEYDLNFAVDAGQDRAYVLKVMRADCDPQLVDLLCAAHAHVARVDSRVPVPAMVPTRSGELCIEWPDEMGARRLVWLLDRRPGIEYARFLPRDERLARDLGRQAARLDQALRSFQHPLLGRSFKWDLCAAEWIGPRLGELADAGRRLLLTRIHDRYLERLPDLRSRPVQAIHNDLNDYNLLVARDERGAAGISAILDFGDMLAGPVVAELAIAAAYLVLDHPRPLRLLEAFISAYDAELPLSDEDLSLLWPLLRMRLAVSVTNARVEVQGKPDDPYVVVSEQPAWRFLELSADWDERRVTQRLRVACGRTVTPRAARVLEWLRSNAGSFAPILGQDLAACPVLDLSVASPAVSPEPLARTYRETNERQGDTASDAAPGVTQDTGASSAAFPGAGSSHGRFQLGRYGEPRLVYAADHYRTADTDGPRRRTVHLGVDVFAPAGTMVRSPSDAIVAWCEYRDQPLDYGGFVVLRHATPDGDHFHALYGHLDRASVAALSVGQSIQTGQRFARLGDSTENGGWPPHLHLQLLLSLEGMERHWPGVCDPDDRRFWMSLCPNPASLLNLADSATHCEVVDEERIARQRTARFASNLRLSYDQPCLLLRGWKHYLFDAWGRTYLDAYNNVPHVGHAHPRIREVACEQLGILNTNTRYLHPAQGEFAETLLARMPAHLTHVFVVNSGSEANELALRLARTHTNAVDMVAIDHGYHGNTTGAYAISAYKFNRPRGGGCPDWVHLVPLPDTYRGPYRDERAAARYAAHIDEAVARVNDRGRRLCGFIAETLPSVGGQIVPPVGYLADVYRRIRAHGGVCIADEVQTGLGRLGHHYWGFQQQEAEPDIVVLGKPLGNGHPLAAVVTTAAIAASFDNGIEFFSTFGGSTLACRIGTTVLQIVEEERLGENAARMGDRLLEGLRELQVRHAVIGDVRGVGLFLGVDLVQDRASREPATTAAAYVKNRLREERILIGTEGPHDNILKIRPPLTIQEADVRHLLATLDGILRETPFLGPARLVS